MEWRFSQEQESLREEIRAFFAQEPLERYAEDVEALPQELYLKLAKRGWLGVALPTEYGGQGRGPVEMSIFLEEASYAGAPMTLYITIAQVGIVGGALVHCATEEQKRRFLPQIIDGTIKPAIGITEPDAGSDAASCQTRAVADGEDFTVTGTKIYSTAHISDYILTVTRTDLNAAKHRGITLFFIDLTSPGVAIRPLWIMEVERRNEVHFEEVRVPRDNMIGQENRGWYHLTLALDMERYLLGDTGFLRRGLEHLIEFVKEKRHGGEPLCSTNPIVRHLLADLAVQIEVARLLFYRASWLQRQGIIPNNEASMSKLYTGEIKVKLASTAAQIAGQYGLLHGTGAAKKWAALSGEVADMYRGYQAQWAVAGGTSEVQRNIIALRGLGLPV